MVRSRPAAGGLPALARQTVCLRPGKARAIFMFMSPTREKRRPAPAVQVVFGVLLAGTGLFLVPTLALNGSILAAAVAAVVWLGGIGVAWYYYRRDLRRGDVLLTRERVAHSLYRSLVEHGSEAHVVIGPDGAVVFASSNIRDILGVDPDHLDEQAGLVDLARGRDRRRVLQLYSRVRATPGARGALEVSARRPDGTDCYVAIRAVNLLESPEVGGVLFTLRDITPRKTFETEIRHLAYYDALTGLPNRRFFVEQGTKALSLARRNREALAVFYLDVDHFKRVNDTLGHERGDRVLKQIATGLTEILRDSDVVGRLGGDEFAVVLTELRDVESAGRVAHRVLQHLPRKEVDGGHEIPVGVSIGVAVYPEDGEGLEALLAAADAAMYEAKAADSGFQYHQAELRQALADQLRMEQDLRKALEKHEFQLHYQPIFNIITGEMAGAEALSRWRHLTRGMVAASEFIRLAEKTGLIRALDRWAIARAIHQRTTQLDGAWKGWVAVNLSPHSLRDPELPDYVREAIETAGFEPGSLVLELPEGSVLEAPHATDLMWDLKNTGAAIALDDYGVGAASLSRLKELPIDMLKLHPDFVAGIGKDSDEQLVEATLAIAHGIRAKVVAKGVEHQRQVEWLRESGCDFVQGYLIGAPVPPQDLAGDRVETGEKNTPS